LLIGCAGHLLSREGTGRRCRPYPTPTTSHQTPNTASHLPLPTRQTLRNQTSCEAPSADVGKRHSPPRQPHVADDRAGPNVSELLHHTIGESAGSRRCQNLTSQF
jgi:hypothetical protein